MKNQHKSLLIIVLLIFLNTCGKQTHSKSMLRNHADESKGDLKENQPNNLEQKLPTYGSELDLDKFQTIFSREQKSISTESREKM